MKKLLCAAIAATFSAAAPAATILVVPTLAPNAFGSPSFATWEQNAIRALHAGVPMEGDSASPTFYKAQSDVTSAEAIVTGFPSWKGRADPGTVFGPQYANELGNRMTFGARIDGDGELITISQLMFMGESNDDDNLLGFAFFGGAYQYSASHQGVLRGADGVLWTGDDVFITSGPDTQRVDGILTRGSGNSFAAYCDGCTIEQQQAAIDEVANWDGYPTQFTGTYYLLDDSGSASFNIETAAVPVVPEPASWAMMLAGFGAVGAAMRRRSPRLMQAV